MYTALFKLNHCLAFLHIWTKEKNWRTSSCHDKHCIGTKMTVLHPSQKTGLTPLFWSLPFLSRDILSCTSNLGQPALGLGRWLEFLLGCSRHQSRHDMGAVQWQISHTLNSWSGLKPFLWSLHLSDYKIPWEPNYKQLMKWCWFQLLSFPISFATFAIPRLHLLTLTVRATSLLGLLSKWAKETSELCTGRDGTSSKKKNYRTMMSCDSCMKLVAYGKFNLSHLGM